MVAVSDDFGLFMTIGRGGSRLFCARRDELDDLAECELPGFRSFESSKNREVLTALAAGPGGFVVLSTEAIYWIREIVWGGE